MGFLSGVGDAIDTGISGAGKLLGSITGATQAAESGEKAAEIQAQYGREAMKQQQQQFETLMRLLSPYQQVGIPAAQRLAGYERELAPTGISAIESQLIPQLMQIKSPSLDSTQGLLQQLASELQLKSSVPTFVERSLSL